MSTMPKQKPGKSEQVVETPDEFIGAVLHRLGEPDFILDAAANRENAKASIFYSEEDSALEQSWNRPYDPAGWVWCNPPYSNLAPWVRKAYSEVSDGVKIAMLVPASVGANWWRDWVDGFAYVTFLNGRITFKGHTSPYPKDLALLLYAPFLEGGSCVWNWKDLG